MFQLVVAVIVGLVVASTTWMAAAAGLAAVALAVAAAAIVAAIAVAAVVASVVEAPVVVDKQHNVTFFPCNVLPDGLEPPALR